MNLLNPALMLAAIVGFNDDWRFAKGDPENAAAVEFDDSDWETVRLPHDWAIAGPFDPDANGFAGKLPWEGVGWYRKTFTLDAEHAGRCVYLDFDGVMAFPKVYVNGQLAGEWDYGYMAFRVDATPFVKFGEENVVAVRADTRRHGTRWYPGAGIYRKVTLQVRNPVHLGHWATYVTTPEIDNDAAKVRLRTTVENHGDDDADVVVDITILDPDGNLVATSESDSSATAEGSHDVDVTLEVANPKRWDIDSPNLYTAVVSVRSGDRVVDEESVTFGIRTFKFTADDGFHLNGRRVQLYGVNLHHDHGPLGAAFYPRAMERQLEIMQEMGVNALRTSHNAPAKEVLELCDRMGIVVWDECFDKWNHTAGRHDGEPPLNPFAERQLRNLVMRDRNHPSVVIWSIANEVGGLGGDNGLTKERTGFMRDVVRKYDDTRPVGYGHHIPEHGYTDVFEPLDVVGYNYERRYYIFRERYPDKPIVYSESASALSTRGFYELPLPGAKTDFSKQSQVNSYDYNSARWSDIVDVEFDLMERDSFVAGEFVWTGFDYLGEPTPFEQEARSSYFGIVDTCGIPKDRYFLYRSYWRPDTATVHILPHWNWPEREGQTVPVFVYTNGDSAELFLNGRSLGRRTKADSVPERVNVAEGRPATASSELDAEHGAERVTDGRNNTRWRAASNSPGQWWQVDLEQVQTIRDVLITFDGNSKDYQYRVQVSVDGQNWQTVVDHDHFLEGWGERLSHGFEAEARFVRIEFTDFRDGARAALRQLWVYPVSYYAVAEKYRLKWMDVEYEPGELRVVAYKGVWPIGEATMRTAGPPAAIRLTPDRTELDASGEDLCYVLVESLDEEGNLCPLADNLVRFSIDGPATIAGVGSGNPLSLEPFQADYRKLFHGKAMLILRTEDGDGGEVRVTAESDGLEPASLSVVTEPARQ